MECTFIALGAALLGSGITIICWRLHFLDYSRRAIEADKFPKSRFSIIERKPVKRKPRVHDDAAAWRRENDIGGFKR